MHAIRDLGNPLFAEKLTWVITIPTQIRKGLILTDLAVYHVYSCIRRREEGGKIDQRTRVGLVRLLDVEGQTNRRRLP